MPKKYKITYRAVKREHTMELMALSKYDAKQRFYRIYPNYQVLKIEALTDDEESKEGEAW